MSAFTIDETTRGDTVALRLAGDLDMSSTFVLEPVLDRVLAAHPLGLVLDLERVPFVDSSGMGLLLATHERATGAGVEMTIAGVAPEIRRVFQVAGLDALVSARST